MTDLMDTLYHSARDILVTDILNEDGEYGTRVYYLENERKRLNATVDKDTARQINNLLDEKALISALREYACFRAGFRMALELTR